MEAAADNSAALLLGSDPQQAKASAWSFANRIPQQDVVNVTAQLAMMSGAGVSVACALKSIARQCQRPVLKQKLQQIEQDVLGGLSLSNALRHHPEVFDSAFVATVAAGEASGSMQRVLSQLADLQRAELQLKRTIRGMLLYPVLLSAVSLVVITTLIIFVLPRFESIFEQYDIALPLVTQLLMGLADELRTRWWIWGPLSIVAVGLLVAARATPIGRDLTDRVMIRTPGVRQPVRTLIAARATRLLGLLVQSGVPLLDSLRLLRTAISNSVFRELVDRLEDSITNGTSLSEALEGNEVLPESATELIATSEKTGRLGEVATMMGTHYGEEGEAQARQVISALEPIVTIGMGAVVAVVVLAVMLPVFDIATIANR